MRERRQPARIFLVVAALALGGCQASSLDRLKQVLLEGPPASVETSAPQDRAAGEKTAVERARLARLRSIVWKPGAVIRSIEGDRTFEGHNGGVFFAAFSLNAYVAERVSRYSRPLGITYTQEPFLEGNKDKRL